MYIVFCIVLHIVLYIVLCVLLCVLLCVSFSCTFFLKDMRMEINMEKMIKTITTSKIKDPGSAITHFIGMLMAIFAGMPLIIKALRAPDLIHVASLSIFIVSMVMLGQAPLITHLTYHQGLIRY